MCFQQPLTQSFGYSPTTEIDWYLDYKPTDNTDHLWGMPACGDNPYWQIIIDQSNDKIWTVYIESWSA